MSIFQKLFGDSSKKGPASKAGQWDAMLSKCDLLMARDEIASMHRMLNAQAEKEGGAHYFKNEYVAAWESFRDRPTIDTARMLLDVAPPLLLPAGLEGHATREITRLLHRRLRDRQTSRD